MSQRQRILLVDDDAFVREVTREMLEAIDFDVIDTDGGAAALELLATDRDFDALVVDFAMPGMNGGELARRIVAQGVTLPIVFVTGYAEGDGMAEVNGRPLVRKPFSLDQLAAALREALGPVSAALDG